MIKLTPDQIQNLRNTGICFSWYDQDTTWLDEGINAVPGRNVFAEDYACYFIRTDFHSIGAFSYAWSPLPEFVSVGRYCSISDGVEITPFTHPTDLFTTSSMVYDPNLAPRRRYYKDIGISENDAIDRSHPTNEKDISIGHDVYIARGAKLRRGITIGNGAIIGAFSVVAKDVEPYAVVVGNPARVVRHRYKPDQIAELNRLEWWNYDFYSVLNKTHVDNIDLFIDRMRHLIDKDAVRAFLPRRHYIRDLLG